jgi:hypothetical protein
VLLLANVLVSGLGCLFAAGIVRDVIAHRSLPPVAPPRASQSPLDAAAPPAAPPPIASYQIIATKNMFNPGRSEATGASAAAAVAAGVRPILHGVVLDGARSRAYLEEPPAPQVVGYAVGDQIAGGRLESIGVDRVVIIRPQGRLEVLLQDPSKPRQSVPTAGGAAAGAPAGGAVGSQGQPIRAPSSSGRVPTPVPPRPQ